MCSFGGGNFRTKLQKRITGLYAERLRDVYTKISEKEIKYFIKEKNRDLGNMIVLKAGDFWSGREDGPTAATISLTRKPYIPSLIENFDTIENEIQTPEDQKTIKPEKQSVTNFIRDEQGLIRNDLEQNNREYGPLLVEDPLKCNRVIINIFKYLEGKMSFRYGRDKKNFGYEELWLTPTQVILLNKSDDVRMRRKEIDCEDMHNYGAVCLDVAKLSKFRYRCVSGERETGYGGHLTLFALDDSLETWRNLEFTPEYTDLGRFVSVRRLPKFGDSKNTMHGRRILYSYSKNGIFSTFNALATKNDFKAFADSIQIEFPPEMFDY